MTMMSKYAEVVSISDDTPNYDDLMTKYAPFVKRIAYHMVGRLPASVSLEDLVQTGMIGLFEALKGYDMSKGASFETYARIRIQGAMIDEVRRCNWMPRSVYKKSRQLSEAVAAIESEHGRDAKDSEIAEYLKISMDEYYRMVNDAAGCQLLSYEDITAIGGCKDELESSESCNPYDNLQDDDFKQSLAEKIANLPKREKMVMSLYYNDEFNLREIGEILGITEGRVCQIHSQALIRLRARMNAWVNDDP